MFIALFYILNHVFQSVNKEVKVLAKKIQKNGFVFDNIVPIMLQVSIIVFSA